MPKPVNDKPNEELIDRIRQSLTEVYQESFKVSVTHVEQRGTGLYIWVNSTYGVAEFACLSQHISDKNGKCAVHLFNKSFSFTFYGI